MARRHKRMVAISETDGRDCKPYQNAQVKITGEMAEILLAPKLFDALCNNLRTTIKSIRKLEKQVIMQALEKADFNQVQASKLLGISRDTLRYKKKKHNL